MIGHRGKTSPDEMKDILTSSAKKDVGSQTEYGAGLLQVHDALVYSSTSNNNPPIPESMQSSALDSGRVWLHACR